MEVKSGGGCCLKVGSWESCCCVGRRSSGCFLDVMRCALLNTCRNNTIVVVVVVVVYLKRLRIVLRCAKAGCGRRTSCVVVVVVIFIVVFIICSVVVVCIVVRCNTVFIFSIVQYSVWMFVFAECFWEGWWHFGIL